MNMDKVICIGYFVAVYKRNHKKNNDVFLHWQHREKCPEAFLTLFKYQIIMLCIKYSSIAYPKS